MMLLLDPTPLARDLAGKKVEVVNYPDGRFAVQFNGTALDFKLFDKIQTVQPGAIVDNKRLSAVLEHIKAQQAAYPAHRQRGHVAPRLPPEAGGLIATAASLVFRYAAAMPLAKPATIVPGQGMVRGFLRDREIYPDAWRRWWLRDRPVAGAGQFRSAPVPSE